MTVGIMDELAAALMERIHFFAGVPDSTLSALSYALDRHSGIRHITAANEAEAIALCAGYHMASGRVAAAYLQNSGLGNAINPLTSLTNREMFGVPLLLVIGWRGQPGHPDAVEHILMGELTLPMLRVLKIPHRVLSGERRCSDLIKELLDETIALQSPVALVVPREPRENQPRAGSVASKSLTRREAIACIVSACFDALCFVSTTGYISRELFAFEPKLQGRTLYSVGAMGSVTAIGHGIATATSGTVVVLDGDGACLMHMGSLATVGRYAPPNLLHIVLDNGSYESTGGQASASSTANLTAIAAACGYRRALHCETQRELEAAFDLCADDQGPSLIHIAIGISPDGIPPRVALSPEENKRTLSKALRVLQSC